MTAYSRRESGVALAVVVWFIAGMSLLVAGVVMSARTDVRLAQLHMGRAQAAAAGDGAVNLLLADIGDGTYSDGSDRRLPQQRYQLGELQVDVAAVPTDWLVDINAATPPLLANALQISGALQPDDAQFLASAVVQWRMGSDGGRATRFDAIEDLLSVQGVNRKTWDRLRDYIAVPVGSGGLSRPGARAQQVLGQLRRLTPTQRLLAASQAPADVNVGAKRFGGYRVDALVKVGDTVWLRRRWVSMNASVGALPWRVYRTEPARIVSRPDTKV
ncbi:general secretory pathway protein K [gamma proteobacterium NOR5-3]|nr:general secretory pathway protein K [gamma proteobacterium NOR5-3]